LPTAQGVIYCSEDDDYDARHETELLPEAPITSPPASPNPPKPAT
jgi:hypothetical protein